MCIRDRRKGKLYINSLEIKDYSNYSDDKYGLYRSIKVDPNPHYQKGKYISLNNDDTDFKPRKIMEIFTSEKSKHDIIAVEGQWKTTSNKIEIPPKGEYEYKIYDSILLSNIHIELNGDKIKNLTIDENSHKINISDTYNTIRIQYDDSLIDPNPPLIEIDSKYFETEKLSNEDLENAKNNLDEAAKNLYSCLRNIKNEGYKSIAVEKIPNIGLGKAINDRLRRASKY